MNDEYIPTLTHATERDIDLILVEELYASPAFVEWMAQRAGLTHQFSRSRVLHSKRRVRNRREIDIFVELYHGIGQRSALLIENKLDASEQPDQAESYREEIDRIGAEYSSAAMLIVCPSSYNSQHSHFTAKFDAIVTYEEISSYFKAGARRTPPPWSDRLDFRHELIEQAIGKHRRGYTPVPNEIVGDFNAKYVSLLERVMPLIKPGPSMLKPANPDESTSMIFDHEASLGRLPFDLRPRRFSHELGRGKTHRANYVAVTFGGWGAALPKIQEILEDDTQQIGAFFLAKPPNKSRPNPGLVMACPAEPVDNQGDFDSQQAQIISGMQKAGTLRDWLLSNVEILKSWKALVERFGK